MPQAKFNNQIIASSDKVEIVENNLYFPINSINKEYLKESQHTTFCPWKGTASYYDIVVDGKVNEGAAWYYPEPKEAASNIKGHVAFWKGIEVTK